VTDVEQEAFLGEPFTDPARGAQLLVLDHEDHRRHDVEGYVTPNKVEQGRRLADGPARAR